MGLKLINVSEIKMYEKELEKQFFEEFNKTKTITYKDYLGNESSFPVNYNDNFNFGFCYLNNFGAVEYYLGDFNRPFKIENAYCNFSDIKSFIVIKINHLDITKSNCRFAYDEKTNERFFLLETVSDQEIIDILKEIGFKFITINSTKKNYLKIEFEKIVDYLEILICNTKFILVANSLKVKKINDINLKEDLHKIKNNNPRYVETNYSDLNTNNNSSNNKFEESNIIQNGIGCSVCYEKLPKNDFRKISGKYSPVCKKCEDEFFPEGFIDIILEYFNHGETFDVCLKLIEDSKIERFEKELKKQFFETFNMTKTINFTNYMGDESSFPVNYNNYSDTWFHYKKNFGSVEYSFGDLNQPFKYESIKGEFNSIKPFIVIKIDYSDITKSNCCFAYDEKTNERFLLLETVSDKKVINNLKRIGFKFITLNSTKKNYLRLEFENIVDYLNILVRNIDFYPVRYSLKVNKIDDINLKEDLHKIKNNNPRYVERNYSDLNTNNNSSNNKFEESNIIQNGIGCSVCYEKLPRNDFRKISGKYSPVCKKCEDKILAANYIDIILEYLIPGKTFNMDKLFKQHQDSNFTVLIFTLQKQNLIKKVSQSIFYLEPMDVLNDFKKKYLIDLKNFNEKPFKSSFNPKSNEKFVKYDKKYKVWCAYVPVNNEQFILGLYDTEEEAYKAHLNYLNIKKFKNKTTDYGINKEVEVPDNIECKFCHEILPKKDFRNILGEYGNVCKKCEDKVLAAKYINVILEYLEPGETFNKDEFIHAHHDHDLSDIIFTLQEQDLIKRDFGSNFYLESGDVLNDFKEKYLNNSN